MKSTAFFLCLVNTIILFSTSYAVDVKRTVKINEVMFNPKGREDEGEEWIELYNTGTEAVDLSGWELGDEDGNWYVFPSITLNPGAYLVIHYNATNTPNDNTNTDLYTGVANRWTNTEDQVSLYNGAIHDETTIIDFVAYCTDTSYTIPNEDDDNAVAANIWNEDAYVDTQLLKEGESFGLSPNGLDTNSVSDWQIFKSPTPGRPNHSHLPCETIIRINEVSFKEEDSKDWIELYCVNDGNQGRGIDIGGLSIVGGSKILKTIKDGTIIKTGEYLVLHQGTSPDDTSSNKDGIIDLFSLDTALISTDSYCILYDSLNRILDAVLWADQDDTFLEANAKEIKELVKASQWIIQGTELRPDDCVDSSIVKTHYSIARDGRSTDTNTKDDWHIDNTPSKGRNNAKDPPSISIDVTLSNRCLIVDGSDKDRYNTTILFTLNCEAKVNLRVYNVDGMIIKRLIDDELLLYGENSVVWDGRDDDGRIVPIGIYILYLEAINPDSYGIATKKIPVVVAKRLD